MKASIDALYTLVTTQNPALALSKDQLHFSQPVRATYEENQAHGRNTKLTLQVPGLPRLGSVDIFYDRLLLKDLLVGSYLGNLTPGEVNVPTGTAYATMSDVLPYLNAHYGTTLVASDVNADDPVVVDDALTALTVTPGSLAYDGQCDIYYPMVAPMDMSDAMLVADIGDIYSGVGGLLQRAVNANDSTFNGFWMDLEAGGFALLDGTTSAAHGGADCSAVLTYNSIENAFTGTATVYYKRIAMNSNQSHTYKLPAGAVNSVDLLPVINARTGLGLTANDIVDEALPTLVDGAATYNLTASPGSFTYTGGLQIFLVDTLPDVATLLTYDADLANSANATDILTRIWATTTFTDNNYNWLRLTSADGYDPSLPLYTVNPAVINDGATQTAHGGREAAVTLTFHETSGVTGELTFYFNRYDLSAVNDGVPVDYTYEDLSRLMLRSTFRSALVSAGGPSLGSVVVQKEIEDFDGMVFVNAQGKVPVTFAAKAGSAMFVGQAQALVSEGAGGGGQV